MALVDCRTHLVRDHVRKARTMAVFAADRELREWRIGEVPVALRRGCRRGRVEGRLGLQLRQRRGRRLGRGDRGRQHGRRGERFVYLSWGEVDDTGTFTMFRRLKLHLMPLVEQCTAERVLSAKRIQAVLELTDTKGRPLAASVRPPWVTWRLLSR